MKMKIFKILSTLFRNKNFISQESSIFQKYNFWISQILHKSQILRNLHYYWPYWKKWKFEFF